MKKFLVCCFVFCCSQVNAQLSLSEAIDIALKNNLNIKIEKNNEEVAKLNNHVGMAGGLPQVTITSSDQQSVTDVHQKLNSGVTIVRSGATANNLNANLTGTLLLYNGNKVTATKKRLSQLEAMGTHQVQAVIQNTIAQVMQKYFELVKQQKYLLTIEKSIDLSKQQFAIIEVKKAEGLANITEWSQSKIDLNNRIQEMQSQNAFIAQLKFELINLLQISQDNSIVFSNLTDSIVLNNNIQLPDVLDGLENNIDVILLDDQVKIEDCIAKETAALTKPSFRLNTGYNFSGLNTSAGQLLFNQISGPFIGVGLSIPIYNGQIYKRQEQIANLNKQTAVLRKTKTYADIETSAINLFQNYTSLKEQIKEQEETYLLSEQLVNLLLEKYKLAAATIVDLREAQKSFEEAGFKRISLLYAAKLAEIELLRLSGRLNK